MNRFANPEREAYPVFRLDPDSERRQFESVRAVRASRNNDALASIAR